MNPNPANLARKERERRLTTSSGLYTDLSTPCGVRKKFLDRNFITVTKPRILEKNATGGARTRNLPQRQRHALPQCQRLEMSLSSRAQTRPPTQTNGHSTN